jgi:replicative DNA helicase
MTAAHQLPALEIVPTPDETALGAAPTPEGDDWRAQSVIDQWSPEHQLIGSLMWLTAEQARPILELVPDIAIWRPRTRWAYEIIRSLVEAGDDPNPAIVLQRARSQPAAGDLPLPVSESERGRRHRALALYLFDAYSQVITPATARYYAREVLDEAYRRAFDTCGTRMQQLASCGADRDDLTTQFAVIRDELAELWRRADAAAKPEVSQA